MAAVSALRIVGPNETGVATSRSARSSSGVKSPSGPTNTPSPLGQPLSAIDAATSRHIGDGGGSAIAPANTLPHPFASSSAARKSTASSTSGSHTASL